MQCLQRLCRRCHLTLGIWLYCLLHGQAKCPDLIDCACEGCCSLAQAFVELAVLVFQGSPPPILEFLGSTFLPSKHWPLGTELFLCTCKISRVFQSDVLMRICQALILRLLLRRQLLLEPVLLDSGAALRFVVPTLEAFAGFVAHLFKLRQPGSAPSNFPMSHLVNQPRTISDVLVCLCRLSLWTSFTETSGPSKYTW